LVLRGHDKFAQHLNICSPTLGEWRHLSSSSGNAPAGNSNWWLRRFDPIVVIANP